MRGTLNEMAKTLDGKGLARKRWAKTSPEKRKAVAREIANARWAKYRAEHPEQAEKGKKRREARQKAAAASESTVDSGDGW